MKINELFKSELNHEYQSSEKILKTIPSDHFSWKPHEKSLSLQQLSHHIVEIFKWIDIIINQEELDFSTYTKILPENTAELMKQLDANYNKSVSALENTTPENLKKEWVLRHGEHIILKLPKSEAIRYITLNHLYHHRGQLSVYLRMLDVKIPGMYGPSADGM